MGRSGDGKRDPRTRIAYLSAEGAGRTDLLIAETATRIESRGHRLAGTLATGLAARQGCDVHPRLRVLRTGRYGMSPKTSGRGRARRPPRSSATEDRGPVPFGRDDPGGGLGLPARHQRR